MHEIIQINDKDLDEILHNNNLKMELAMQFFSIDKTVRSNREQNLKDFNSQTLATQVEKGEQLVSAMPAFKKAFDLMGVDLVILSTKKDALKNEIGSYDEKL